MKRSSTPSLTRSPPAWSKNPGLCSHAGLLARQSYSAKRPKLFFREASALPEKTRLQLTKPPALSYLSDARYQQLVARAVKERVKNIRRKRSRQSVLGRAAILSQDPFDSPIRKRPDRGLTPRVACKDKWQRIVLLTALKDFRHAYRDAWESWKAGKRNAAFPHGTYWMHRAHGVRITGPPLPA